VNNEYAVALVNIHAIPTRRLDTERRL
jgi:hypothetical protein